jgi:hypothetical protein
MQARNSTDASYLRRSDLENKAVASDGYNIPVNDKGKGKDLEIPKDKDNSIDIPKESLESVISSSSSSSSSSYPIPNSELSYPLTPFNTPSRHDIHLPNSSNENGGNESGATGGTGFGA